MLTFFLIIVLVILGFVMWICFASLNPTANCDERKWALIKRKDKNGTEFFELIRCKKFVLKEFKETKTMSHVTNKEYESLYFYDRERTLYSYNETKGLQKMSDVYKAEILEKVNVSWFNIYNYFGVKRFRNIIEMELYNEGKN